jgi:hypothetical protein
MKSKRFLYILCTFTLAIFIFSCSKKDSTAATSTTTTTPTTPTSSTVLSVYSKIYCATSITSYGTYITIKTSDQPDHKSVYWPTSNSLYEAFTPSTGSPSFTGGAFIKAPNNIATQTITLKIPLNPVVSATHSATPMGESVLL